MNQQDRELFASFQREQQKVAGIAERLDERSLNTWKSVDAIEKHLQQVNNNVAENSLAIAESRKDIESNRHLINILIRIVIPAVTLCGSAAAIGTNIAGLW